MTGLELIPGNEEKLAAKDLKCSLMPNRAAAKLTALAQVSPTPRVRSLVMAMFRRALVSKASSLDAKQELQVMAGDSRSVLVQVMRKMSP